MLHVDPESDWTSLPLWSAPQGDQLCGTRHGRCQVHPGQVLQGLPSSKQLCVVCEGVEKCRVIVLSKLAVDFTE